MVHKPPARKIRQSFKVIMPKDTAVLPEVVREVLMDAMDLYIKKAEAGPQGNERRRNMWLARVAAQIKCGVFRMKPLTDLQMRANYPQRFPEYKEDQDGTQD